MFTNTAYMIARGFDRCIPRSAIIAALCLTWAAGVARADYITYTFQTPLDITNASENPITASQSFDLPQFNPTLGTLTSVVVSTQTVAEFRYEIYDTYGNPCSGQVYFTSEAGTTGTGINIDSGVGTPLVSVSFGQFGDYYSPTYMPEDDVRTAVTPDYLSQFIGSGSNLFVQYAGPTPADYGTPGFNFIGNFPDAAGQLITGDVTITATFTYTFTASVPEPSSFVLASLGAVGMGFLSRRSCHFSRKKRISGPRDGRSNADDFQLGGPSASP